MDTPAQLTPKQRSIVLLIGAVQFVNILDFVMVMPLGPDFAKAGLGISESDLGYVGAAYTGAACISGLVGGFFLDQFDRRKALAGAMLGLVLGTAAGGLAIDRTTLLLARVVAGLFGGPATSISLSIIADAIPASLRGRAMGTVMGAFSLASVLGLPAGLWLGHEFSWRAPFMAVAGVGLGVGGLAIFALPPMTLHLQHKDKVALWSLVSQPLVQMSYLMTAVVMMAGFVIIPNISAYVQLNLGFPRSSLMYAYGLGGVASLLATQLGGRAVDRFGSFRVGTVGAFLVIAVVFGAFYVPHRNLHEGTVLLVFMAFMVANGLRNVSYTTLTTKVPAAEVRARFQSLQSATQHGASALAAALSARMLTINETSQGVTTSTSLASALSSSGSIEEVRNAPLVGHVLVWMDRVALVSMALSLGIPVLLFVVERRVKRRS